MDFEIITEISQIEPIAKGHGIHDLKKLSEKYGKGNWRKMKGMANVRLIDDTEHLAEIHWYEAHGIGKKEFKLKFPLRS